MIIKKHSNGGGKLNAGTELFRTYFEIAKSLKAIDPAFKSSDRALKISTKEIRNKHKLYRLAQKIIGLTREECLNKAETMFHEMNLQWDLEQLQLSENLHSL